jgi:quinol monooxygenase YgiN
MVIATLRMSVPPEKQADTLRTLRTVMGPTRAQLRCISCRLYQDVEDANLVTFVQVWESQEDLNEHIRSDDYRKVLAVMELAGEQPEIKFIRVAHTAGMELIKRLRG